MHYYFFRQQEFGIILLISMARNSSEFTGDQDKHTAVWEGEEKTSWEIFVFYTDSLRVREKGTI